MLSFQAHTIFSDGLGMWASAAASSIRAFHWMAACIHPTALHCAAAPRQYNKKNYT